MLSQGYLQIRETEKGMNIYVTGPVGTSGALKIYQNNRAFYEARFADFFCRQIESMGNAEPAEFCDRIDNYELSLAKKEDCIYICTITDRGLYGALWDGCEKLKCGCEVFLKHIPIRQETVEITELSGDDPYEIESFGDLLIFAEKEDPDVFPNAGTWHWIGKTTASKDRVILNGETRRFLTPPRRQLKDTQNRKEEK